jgi:hypothetical protein
MMEAMTTASSSPSSTVVSSSWVTTTVLCDGLGASVSSWELLCDEMSDEGGESSLQLSEGPGPGLDELILSPFSLALALLAGSLSSAPSSELVSSDPSSVPCKKDFCLVYLLHLDGLFLISETKSRL